MSKSLVVYGTRYGATAETSEIIADVLRQEGFEVRVMNAKKEKIQSISEYNLVIVGSGIQMGRWTSEPERFIQKFQRELSQKKVALFVSSGSAHPLSKGEEKIQEIVMARSKYLAEKASKYNLNPIALGLFGGVYDYNKMNWFLRKTMSSIKVSLEEAGFKEDEPGRYETRDFESIRSWTKKVALMANE